MATILFLLGVLGWLVGGGLFLAGATSIHQILGGVIATSGSVLFAAGAIVGTIQDAQLIMETRIAQAVKAIRGEPPEAPTPEE